MADIRIKDLPTTASLTASDDFIAIDGTTNGTRKLSAAAPSFLTSVTTPSLTSPASTNLTLGTTDSGAAITVLSESNNVGIGTTGPGATLHVKTDTGFWLEENTGGPRRLKFEPPDMNGSSNNAKIYVSGTGLGFELGTNTGSKLTILDSGNVGIGTTNPGSTLTLATVDTLLKPALGLRQANALGYGYDFDTETASVGRLDLYRVSNNVRTQMMSWRQDTGNVTIASTTAGSSGAGALVVQGGISAGNTGAASYFGGAVTVTGTLRATNGNLYTYGESGNATDGILFFNSAANNYIYGTGSQLAIYTAGVQRATISSTGATFAGTVSPQQATTAAAPAYVKGAIYFDTTLNKLRVGGATAYETITSV